MKLKKLHLKILLILSPALLNSCASFLEAKQKGDRIEHRKSFYIKDGKSKDEASNLAREDIYFHDMRHHTKENWIQRREASYISSGKPEMDAKRQAYRDWWRMKNDPDSPQGSKYFHD